MNDRAIPGRPGPGVYASGGVLSPRYRFPVVGEGAEERPVALRLVDQVAPIQTVEGPGASRNMMIQQTMKRGS